jgi:hypothetical protein
MFFPSNNKNWLLKVVTSFGLGLVLITLGSLSRAEGLGIIDSFSPYIYMPNVQGEVRARPTIAYLANENARDRLGFTKEGYYIDLMVRLQLNRLSVRLNYDPGDFVAKRGGAEARFSYNIYRLGGDFDIAQWNRSRLGINIDYDLSTPELFMSPLFIDETIFTHPTIRRLGLRLTAQNPMTLGAHLVYNPVQNFCGVTGIVDARARWPVAGAPVTEWEISAGLKAPETPLGSWAGKFGFKSTNLTMDDSYAGARVRFDGAINSWFIDLTYYY